MRVAHLTGWFFPDSVGGTENYVDALAREQARSGHDVHIGAPRPGAGSISEYRHSGIPVFRYPTPANSTRSEVQGLTRVRGTEHLLAYLRKLHPDVIHIHSITTGLGVREIEQLRALTQAVVITHHTSGLGYLCQRGSMMQWGRELCDGICEPVKCAACELEHRGVPIQLARAVAGLPAVTQAVLGAVPGKVGTLFGMVDVIKGNQAKQRRLSEVADGIVVLTEWAANALRRSGIPASKVSINRLGVASSILERPRHRAPREGGTLRVGYLGRFEPIKGPQVLVAATKLLSRDLAIEVEFRGPMNSDSEVEFVDALRTQASNDPRIRFESPVTPSEVADILSTYDVLCCPSLCLEGGPTVALEAQALGVPVVGARIGGLAEIIDDGVNGRLFEPGDTQMLARIMCEICKSPSETVLRWVEAQPAVRTSSMIAADYEQTYERAIGSSKAASSDSSK